jgi:endonuclease/exonuclease/phosphatase family metal-dependent hydrolase
MNKHFCKANNVYNIGILSKYRIVSGSCFNSSPITKTVNIVGLDIDGRTVYVYGTHMAPPQADPVVRGREMQAIVNLAGMQHPKDPRIIIGDFNSITPGESVDPAYNLGMTVVPILTAAGYVDSFREVNPPSVRGYTRAPSRIDYVFHDKSLKATAATVVSKPTPWPSDHLAVSADLTAASGAPCAVNAQ